MLIFFQKGLTRNAEIGNTPPEFFPLCKDWGKLETQCLARMSNEMKSML